MEEKTMLSSEEDKEVIDAAPASGVEALSLDDLAEVSGGRDYTIAKNSVMFCPYCMKKHVIPLMNERSKVGRYYHKIYYCYRAKNYFICATNGYFTLEDERIHTSH